jgi:hypothetical protein
MGHLKQETELAHRATNEEIPAGDGDIAQTVDGRYRSSIVEMSSGDGYK